MTLTSKIAAVMLLAMTGLVLSPRVSSAEWFADVYAGVSLTQSHDLTIQDPIAGQGVYRDTDFSPRSTPRWTRTASARPLRTVVTGRAG